ncbi:sensor domain-containing diguanylate cyclase [Thermithiobacillus plumbiphilus]|uniref:diguanylate cyclase n=1 Tax=Thermithiobacillus plumbiphilus TaxID=1729899 RepID=A0ABU9DCT2_9PROT
MSRKLVSLNELIRSQMLVVLIAALLAVGLNSFFLMRSYKAEELRSLELQGQQLGLAIAASLDSFLIVTRSLAQDDQIRALLRSDNEQRIVRNLETRLSHIPRAWNLALVDADGKIHAPAGHPLSEQCRQSIQQLRLTGSPARLPLHQFPDPVRGHVDTLEPVMAADGRLLGYVFVSYRLAALQQTLERFHTQDIGMRIRDSQGRLVHMHGDSGNDAGWLASSWQSIPGTLWQVQIQIRHVDFHRFLIILFAVNVLLAAAVLGFFRLIQIRLLQAVQAEMNELHGTLAAIHRGQTTLPPMPGHLLETERIWKNIATLANDIGEQRARLEHLTLTDPLTGLANRRHLDMELNRALALASRGVQACLALIDLDHFKDLNDSAGHLAGDEALRLFAEALREQARTSDFSARLGGDEFVLLCTHSEMRANELWLRRFAESFKARLQRHNVLRNYPVTLSIGIITLDPLRDRSPADCLRRADEALYQAKQQGRNRVVYGN